MKTLPTLLACILVSATVSFAATTPAAGTPPAKTAPAKKDPAAKPDAPSKPDAVKADAPAPAPPAPANILDAYFDALSQTMDLTDPEKKAIEDRYRADIAEINKIGNDDSLSPLVKAQKIAALRDDRNDKIAAILHDIDRKKSFSDIEPIYRVDLTTYALDQQIADGTPPAPAPATPPVSNTAAPAPAKSDTGGKMSTDATPAKPAATTPPPATNAPVAEPAPAK